MQIQAKIFETEKNPAEIWMKCKNCKSYFSEKVCLYSKKTVWRCHLYYHKKPCKRIKANQLACINFTKK